MVSVLVVDDSPIIREVFSRILKGDPDISEVRTARDPYEARDLIAERVPEVMTLDVEMPRLDGISFLRKVMAHHPIPVVVVSSLTGPDSAKSLEALESGAVEVLRKPAKANEVMALAPELRRAVKEAARVDVRRHRGRIGTVQPRQTPALLGAATDCVIAVGASTGGTIAVEAILRALPADTPGTIVVQHMPAFVTAAFAARLHHACALEVVECRTGITLRPGLVVVAPGDKHILLRREGIARRLEVIDGPRVNHHRPSIDVLLRSVAQVAGSRAIGVVLTGMGGDGARGLLEMRKAGARTLAQDEATSVVFGIPKVAIQLGAVEEVLPLQSIAARVCHHVTAMGQRFAPNAVQRRERRGP